MLSETVDPVGTSSTKSMICVPDGTVDSAFAFFRLRLSFVLSLSPILRFEGPAPKTAEKEGNRLRGRKKKTCDK